MDNEHKCTQNIKKKSLGYCIVVTRNTETFGLSFINYSSKIRMHLLNISPNTFYSL